MLLIGGTIFGFIWRQNHTPSPVPATVKSQLNFPVIYPKGYQIDKNSWNYINTEQTLSFSIPNNGNKLVFTEQKVPLSYADDAAAYDRFVGSLKPYINFKVPLGSVSLVAFVTAGDFRPQGRTGILKTKDTLLTAHPDNMMTDQQWLELFKSLVTE